MHIFSFGIKIQVLLVLGFIWTMATGLNKTCLSASGNLFLYNYIITIDIYIYFSNLNSCPYKETVNITELPPEIRKVFNSSSSMQVQNDKFIFCKDYAKLDLKQETVLFSDKNCSYYSEDCTINVLSKYRRVYWARNYNSCKDLELLYNGTILIPQRYEMGNGLKKYIILQLPHRLVLLQKTNVDYNHCVNITAKMTTIDGVIVSKKNITNVTRKSNILNYNFANNTDTSICEMEINNTVTGQKDRELMEKLINLEEDLNNHLNEISGMQKKLFYLSITSAVCVIYFIVSSIANMIINFHSITKTKVGRKPIKKMLLCYSFSKSLTTFYLYSDDDSKKLKKEAVNKQDVTYKSTDHLYESV